jgi:CxxC motif-containing protein (DUF1111 family)
MNHLKMNHLKRCGRIGLSGLLSGLTVGLLSGLVLAVGCESPPPDSPPTIVSEDPTDIPLPGVSPALRQQFLAGDAAFDAVFLDGDGLGPNYIRTSCGSCHAGAGKGPGSVQKMVLVQADGVTPAGDQSALLFGNTVRPYYAGGAQTGLLPPSSNPQLKLSLRVGLPVFGRGYLEAIEDREIERVESEQSQRTDEIHGRINRVVFQSQANSDKSYHQYQPGQSGLIGRFGHKARIATLDDFSADAAQGDMSITSPMRPSELPNPDGKLDDRKPGPDIDLPTVNMLADYMRLLAIPHRTEASNAGPKLFEEALCSVCHVPALKTRSSYPIPALAGKTAPVFTDLLLHDMGVALADGLTDGMATSRQWRTAPLIGLRFFQSYLHDGRGKTIEEAIQLHHGTGSEANGSVAKFRALSASDRQELISYVSSL